MYVYIFIMWILNANMCFASDSELIIRITIFTFLYVYVCVHANRLPSATAATICFRTPVSSMRFCTFFKPN